MQRGVIALLIAQFLSAFGDNAILFAAIGMVLSDQQTPGWYIAALQAVFLVAYVVAAPWVGPFADRFSKPRVLLIGNLVKATGVGLILLGVEPLLAYALVGLGAAIYSPAKYGILPEMLGDQQLVKANAWIEATTIAAIIFGTVAGGQLADYSVRAAFWMVAVSYLMSMLVTFAITKLTPRGGDLKRALTDFHHTLYAFMQTPRARFAMLGGSLFWGTAAVLRVLLVTWVPLILATQSASAVSELVLFLGVGVIIGSGIVPRLIPLQQLHRTRLAGYAMGFCILLFAFVDSVWAARGVLFLIGIAGGLFIVPINAALQQIGHVGVGSGRAVAVQNFYQNLAMLITVGIYTGAVAADVHPATTLLVLGISILAATLMVARRLATSTA
ncbi:Lysophospholipid transporter LplT [hydrothermal vent metagenome]|uniref:Lysophospholipid transporter LplT n=1 Tax=hydrothermal vent metagenome TaxID=652676 RepID=A0A3B0YS25_9ZZZZ